VSSFLAAVALPCCASFAVFRYRFGPGLVGARLIEVGAYSKWNGRNGNFPPSGRGRGVWKEGGRTRFTLRMSFVPASRKNSVLFVWCSSDAIACLAHLGGGRASLSCALHSVQYILTTPLVTTTAVPSSGKAHWENDQVDSAILKIITQCRSQ
jgi:hypothetical protein